MCTVVRMHTSARYPFLAPAGEFKIIVQCCFSGEGKLKSYRPLFFEDFFPNIEE